MNKTHGHQLYNVVRVEKKTVNGKPKKFFRPIGTILLREGGQNGALFLNHTSDEFALFLREPKAEAKRELTDAEWDAQTLDEVNAEGMRREDVE